MGRGKILSSKSKMFKNSSPNKLSLLNFKLMSWSLKIKKKKKKITIEANVNPVMYGVGFSLHNLIDQYASKVW